VWKAGSTENFNSERETTGVRTVLDKGVRTQQKGHQILPSHMIALNVKKKRCGGVWVLLVVKRRRTVQERSLHGPGGEIFGWSGFTQKENTHRSETHQKSRVKASSTRHLPTCDVSNLVKAAGQTNWDGDGKSPGFPNNHPWGGGGGGGVKGRLGKSNIFNRG